ncbi:MAG: hypothetical protein AAF432_15065 [Planctomycetota bacterium]
MKRSRPLFAIDPGWFYVLSGLAICAACVLIPARMPLNELDHQRMGLAAERDYLVDRLDAHAHFLDHLDLEDPVLWRRLAASQLNVVPASDTPVLVNTSSPATITDWIDESVRPIALPSYAPPRKTTLTNAAAGPHRLLFLASGVLCIMVGLILGPDRPSASRHAILTIDDAAEASAVNLATPIASAPRLRLVADDDDDEDASVIDIATAHDLPAGSRFESTDTVDARAAVAEPAPLDAYDDVMANEDGLDAPLLFIAPASRDEQDALDAAGDDEDVAEDLEVGAETEIEDDVDDVVDDVELDDVDAVDEVDEVGDGDVEPDAEDALEEDEDYIYVDEDGNEIDPEDVDEEEIECVEDEDEVEAVDDEPVDASVDDDDESEEDEEYVYVDEDGNEIAAEDVDDEEYEYVDEDGNVIDADDVEDDEDCEYVYVDEDGNEIDPDEVDEVIDDTEASADDDEQDDASSDQELEYSESLFGTAEDEVEQNA